MPTRKDDQGFWHAEVCVSRRRLHRRLPQGSSASDAKRVEAELTNALHTTDKRNPVIPGDPLLTELMAAYIIHCDSLRSPETAKYHALRIGRWIEGKRTSEIREVAAAIKDDLLKAYKPATVNRSLGALSKALKMAFESGRLKADLSGIVKRIPENNQRTTYLSMEQVKALGDCASENTRAAIWLALLTGCRRGEICKVKLEDIGKHTIKLLAGNTKTLRYREVPIVPALRPWLKYLPLPINFEGVKSGFARARKKAKMPGVKFHDLRHSCATILLQLGAEMHVVREILGHTSVKTTERYAHVMVQPQRDALSKLGATYRKTMDEKKRVSG